MQNRLETNMDWIKVDVDNKVVIIKILLFWDRLLWFWGEAHFVT